MLRASLCVYVCFGCLVSVPVPTSAQEVIHALTGTVTDINQAAKTITVLQDSGSKADFLNNTNPKTRLGFDKKLAAEVTAADAFKNSGAYVIVFYYGGVTRDRTVIALKDLGAGPFTATVGTVERYDGHSHTLSVASPPGPPQTFKIAAETVAESDFGVVEGTKFSAQKGDHVRVVGATIGGTATALFVRDN